MSHEYVATSSYTPWVVKPSTWPLAGDVKPGQTERVTNLLVDWPMNKRERAYLYQVKSLNVVLFFEKQQMKHW